MTRTLHTQLLARLRSRSAIIGVVGMGYVGLPLALRFSEAGYPVLGFDIEPNRVKRLNEGASHITHIGDQRVSQAQRKGFRATTRFEEVATVDAVILCVPTPLNRHRDPDLRFVTGTLDTILPYLQAGQVLSLESTTYPGTTVEHVLPRLESAGFQVGDTLFLVYSPEREDPGNPAFCTQNIPKVCGGDTPACRAAGVALYEQAIDTVVPVRSTRVAEMTKLLENIHRAVNIGLVNEMKIVADRMGINIHEVIQAAQTKPFGFVPYYPGPGLGGHCLPIDPFYLAWKAREYGISTRFIELAGEVNTFMPKWVVGKVIDALNDAAMAIRGARILVLGIAYKKNIDDMRESPSAELLELLQEKGAVLAYSDPHVPVFPQMRKYCFDLASVDLTADTLGQFDLVLLATDHDGFDYTLIRDHARLIVDTRGRYAMDPAPHIVSA